MTHANVLLTLSKAPHRYPSPRRRQTDRPIRRRTGMTRSTLEPRVNRYHTEGPEALYDCSSAPARRPIRLPIEVISPIDSWLREHMCSPQSTGLLHG